MKLIIKRFLVDIVFETVGIATQDLVTARFIYDLAVEKRIGTEW